MSAGEDTAMKAETFDSVFDALTDSPIEAANMTARADLLLASANGSGAGTFRRNRPSRVSD
jgi:hypothetical protein